MAPLPKRRHSTRRGGKRWHSRLVEFAQSLSRMNLLSNKNKHLRSLTANKQS